MKIELIPVNDDNREAILALSVREDQPFVAPNDVSLRQADETNEEYPGVALSKSYRRGGFLKKNGYLIRGKLKDVPKGHDCCEL